MTLPVSPALFDLLTRYARRVAGGKINPTDALKATSPALVFCENFFAQFFQNELGKPIKRFDQEAKVAAVRLRVALKKKRTSKTTILLITWFEKLCDIYPDVLALGYGAASPETFAGFHSDYLSTLLARIAAWAKAKRYARIETEANAARKALKKSIRSSG